MKKREILDEQKAEKERLKAEGKSINDVEVSDKDFADYYDFLEKEKSEDEEAEGDEE